MAVIAFPSENAVGTLFGSSTRILRERHLATWLACGSTVKRYVGAGFDVTAVPASNGVRLLTSALDYAVIDGYFISYDATVTLTGLTDNTHYIYAQLTKVSNLVTGWELLSNTTGTLPTDAVWLAMVVVTGGVAGTPTNVVKIPTGYISGSYAGNNVASGRLIFIGAPAQEIKLYGPTITSTTGYIMQVIHPTEDIPSYYLTHATDHWTHGLVHATAYHPFGFTVGTGDGFNISGATYYWSAKF